MSIHPLLYCFENGLVLEKGCTYIPIKQLGYLFILGTEITQLKPKIARIFFVYGGKKIIGIHQKHIRMKGWLIRSCAGGGKDCPNHSVCRITHLVLLLAIAIALKTNKLLINRRDLDIVQPAIRGYNKIVLDHLRAYPYELTPAKR